MPRLLSTTLRASMCATLHTPARNSQPTGPNRACVYVLARRDRRRFKLGWARSPMHRARQLPEFRRDELDLDGSRVIWLPTRPRAEQIERSMHKTLAPYRVDAEHRAAGSQEWFAGHAQDTALRMLGQMPLGESSHLTARVVRLTLPAPPADALTIAMSIETGPQETWWRLEDLFSRLVMHCRITVQEGDELVLTVHRLRLHTGPEMAELRRAALDADSYQCWRDGRPLAFVQIFSWQGDDLVLRMTPMKVLERWEDGAELAWQVRGFLARLKRQAPLRQMA
ncbi:MAG: GIY-YIG nuclease family protein [Burkholderiales bacterium]|nr:GIY-YIG nuclease family protein [Burkholderiales bacterium]